jgi:hypothetical protein
MSHLDILLPFALPPAEIARDLLRELKAPAFAQLLSRAKSGSDPARECFEGFHRALPHEIWLARCFGVEGAGSPQAAPGLMQALGLPAEPGTWFLLQPVHIHIARDHLVLTDQRQLQISDTEARDLFSIAQELFAETGKTLLYGNAATWFVRADEWAQLQTSSPDAAGGRNIDIWMPSGPGERDWRKVQNEVQMHWFTHPINAEREASGRKPINSIWLWGGGSFADHQDALYATAFNLDGWMQAFAPRVSRHARADSALAALASIPGRSLACLDKLIEPALSNDWARWLANMQELEAAWFAPLLDALKSGKLQKATFILSDDAQLARFAVTRSSLRKFWVSPSLAPLASPVS